MSCLYSWLRKKSLNGYELNRRPLNLGEAEPEKVIMQSFNVEEPFLEESLLIESARLCVEYWYKNSGILRAVW